MDSTPSTSIVIMKKTLKTSTDNTQNTNNVGKRVHGEQ